MFEEGITSILTIQDFTQIFDAYAESLESVISTLMDSLANPDDEDEADVTEIEQELDEHMRMLEELCNGPMALPNQWCMGVGEVGGTVGW